MGADFDCNPVVGDNLLPLAVGVADMAVVDATAAVADTAAVGHTPDVDVAAGKDPAPLVVADIEVPAAAGDTLGPDAGVAWAAGYAATGV